MLEPDEAAIVNRNINNFIRAYNRKSDVIEGVPADIMERFVDRATSASSVANLDHEIDRLRRFKVNGLTDISLRIYENPEWTIRLIGEQVIPALA